ncbi:MAG TPA: serine hydrolase domain-containing protein [Lapillicoccus sp.]|nr:serine hydrolase domain-containing protein [Lapillicoccus sp.]
MSDPIRRALEDYVEAGAVPGLVWSVVRDGEVSRGELGTSRPGGSGVAVTADTLFRLSSTTKPVTAAVAMTLVEDGTLGLDDPVDGWLPELADRRVLSHPEAGLTDTVPAARPILVRDVLEFRLGLGYDFAGPPTAVLDTLEESGVHMGPPAPQANPDPDAWLALFAPLPLMYQPGEKWLYNVGAEVLGVLVARASGTPLPELLRSRVLEPLGMRDTGFSVPAADLSRLGPLWTPAQPGDEPSVYDEADGQWSRPPAFPNGADGLVSTVDDVVAFGQGLFGAALLPPETVREMTTSRTTVNPAARLGWGLGLGVLEGEADGRHAGSYGWDGGLGTSWWNDPVTRTTAVLLTNQTWTSPEPPEHFRAFWRAAFGE